MRRTLGWDGLLPNKLDEDGRQTAVTPADLRDMATYVATNRQADGPFQIVMEGQTPGDRPSEAAAIVGPWREAGATWWVESDWADWSVDKLRKRIAAGPPRAR
jgi:hypothetical protein